MNTFSCTTTRPQDRRGIDKGTCVDLRQVPAWIGGTRRQPARDIVGHQRRGRRQAPQRLDRVHNRACPLYALGRWVFHQASQVASVSLARVAGQLTSNVA